jgi:hypothetical protein
MYLGRCPIALSACEPTAGQDPPHCPVRLEIRILAFIRASVTRRLSQGVSGVDSTLVCPLSGRSSRSAPRPPAFQLPHTLNTRPTGPENTQERFQGRAKAGAGQMVGRRTTHWSRKALDIPHRRAPHALPPAKAPQFGTIL